MTTGFRRLLLAVDAVLVLIAVAVVVFGSEQATRRYGVSAAMLSVALGMALAATRRRDRS